jgi:regulator of RNase E activity RraA
MKSSSLVTAWLRGAGVAHGRAGLRFLVPNICHLCGGDCAVRRPALGLCLRFAVQRKSDVVMRCYAAHRRRRGEARAFEESPMDETTRDAITKRLSGCYSGVVHDVMRGMGLRDFTLPPDMRPIMPDKTLAGPAFTILGKVDPTADPHQTLVEWTGLLSKAKPGHIWVSKANDMNVANMGELSAETLKNKGVLGCVIDGLVRDVNFLLAMEFQTWARGFTPRDIVGYWLPAAIEVPVKIGDVTVEPGDFLIGDRDGMCRVPSAIAADVVEKAEAAINTENKVRTAILSGMDPQQAYLTFGKF